MGATDGHAPGKRVLVVDDCVDTARMMKILLKREGHDVRTACDGLEAFQVAIEFLPSVVLLDLTLPGLSGQQVALKLRENPAFSAALIVAISGYSDQGVPPGFDHLLVKPFDHDALKTLLASHDTRQGLTSA
jgi:CheY-like chemotaxis protein